MEVESVQRLSTFAGGLQRVLESAYALGLKKHGDSRFERYVRILQSYRGERFPLKRVPPEEQRLIFEAASQAHQLQHAATVWPKIDPEVAREKLQVIFKGSPLPPDNPDVDDKPRNTLFEFMAASTLQSNGFTVSVTASDEDVEASHPAFDKPLAIECKRPTKSATVRDNLRKLRKQLNKRCEGGKKYGVGVLGIDRVSGLSGKTPNVPSTAELQDILESGYANDLRHLQRGITQSSKQLYPAIPLMGILTSFPVYTLQEGTLYMVGHLGLTFTVADQHVSPSLREAVRGTFQYKDPK